VDLLELNGEVIFGSNESYLQLIEFVEGQNISSEANYKYVSDQIDIENMIVYQIAQIYFNNKYKGGKWRWVLFDTDFGLNIWNNNAVNNNTLAFALSPNGPDWPNPPWSTLLFRELIENQDYRHQFINRFADEMNTRFLSANVSLHIDATIDLIRSEMPSHFRRWGSNPTVWNNNLNRMKAFAGQRSSVMKEHIKSEFSLPSHHTLTINNPNPTHGYVRLNSLLIDKSFWQGDYFETVPVKMIAIPKKGYKFSHWEGLSNSMAQEITLDLTGASNITPNFVEETNALVDIMINEVNYNSTDDHDTGDWIELYNPSSSTKDISGWYLSDNEDDHQYFFPDGTLIRGDGYLVVARDKERFENFHEELDQVIGNMSFGLSATEDAVRLFNGSGELVDVISYTSTAPWPEEANGMGYTLELVDPSLDNAMPENWGNIHQYGSPGTTNLERTSSIDLTIAQEMYISPNPAKDHLNIQFELDATNFIEMKIFSTHGQVVLSRSLRNLQSGKFDITIDLTSLSEGMYILSLSTEGGKLASKRFFKTK